MEQNSDYINANDKPTEMSSLTSCTEMVLKEGYTENFRIEQDRLVSSQEKGYEPHEVRVVNFYRFEGDSDPGDNSVLYVIETTDGLKGSLINGMGAYADEHISRFMKQVEEINKRMAG